MPDTLATDICRRFEDLTTERSNWEDHWQEVAEVIAPRKSDMVGNRSDGDKRQVKVYDSTGIQMNELLAAGLHGMATNPAARWFGLRVLDDDLMEQETVKEYLAEVEGGMFREMHAPGASISTHLHEDYLDAGAFGVGVLFIADNEGRPQFQARHMREMYLADGADGNTDTVFRKFKMTARQIKQQWPDRALQAVDKAMAGSKPDQKFEIIHAVFPREEREERSRLRQNMPIASIYVLIEGKELIDEGGFEEMPYAILHWSKNPGEAYGRGPGMTALPDVKMLQQMMKVHLRAGQKLVDPPLLTNHDSVVGPVRTMPGGINYLMPGGDIRPLITGARLDLSFEMMQDVRNRVGQIFFADVVRPFAERTNETATEVMQRVQQQMRLMGPVLGRLEQFLGQIIARVYGILSRAGKLPEAPEELDKMPFTVEFVSPIATAQRTGEVENALNWLSSSVQFMQFNQGIANRINWEAWPAWTADRLRIDPELVLSEDEAQAAQAPQQAAQIASLAPAAKDGAAAIKAVAEAQQIAAAG